MNRSYMKGNPHLTPANLVGLRFGKNTFEGIKIALVGYCPRPDTLDKYDPKNTVEQYFIHVPPANVQICNYSGIKFLSITHVYGGPVSSALIEELAYYGVKYVLAYGLAGGLGTKEQRLGDFYIVEKAFALDGTTRHYTDEKLVSSNSSLNAKIKELAEKTNFAKLTPVQALTDDAIYREYEEELKTARENGCDIVNCDSSHLFAVSQTVGIITTECGIISDVAKNNFGKWDSALSVMLSDEGETKLNPLTLTGKIVELYIEHLMQKL